LSFFARAFLSCAAHNANLVEKTKATGPGKILCRKHTMATHPYPAFDGWKKEIRSSANEKAL